MFLLELPVIIPDMVRYKVIQDLSKPGAEQVAEWLRESDSRRLIIGSTEVYEEFLLLRSLNSQIKIKNREEQSAAEILSRNVERNEFGTVLIFEDSAVRNSNFLTPLPESVVITSTSEFLFGVGAKAKGLIPKL